MRVKFDKILQTIRESDTPIRVSESSKTTLDGTCNSTADVGDAVYVDSNGLFQKASASSKTEVHVIGFIDSKSSSTTCKIVTSGIMDKMSGLITGQDYFLSETSGKITTTPPTTSGSITTHVGKAINSTTLMVGLSNVYTIRS